MISDDFNRVSIGPNWTINFGASQCQIISANLGMGAGANSFFLATWTGTQFYADQWCAAQISVDAPSDYLEQVYVRRDNATGARYGFGYDGDPSQPNFGEWIFKYDGVAGPSTRVFASSPALVLPEAGDTLMVQISGYTLRGYIKKLGSSIYTKVLEGTDTDPSKIPYGSPGLAARLAAGNLPLASPVKIWKSFSGDSTMATISKRLSGPALLSNAAATKYTCPPSTVAVVRRGRVSNPTGSPATFIMSLGADATGTRIYNESIPANGSLDIYGPFSLAAGDIIQAYSGTNNALVLELDGTESV